MSRRIAETALNASTIDILNVIRQNATYEYQQLVPEVTQASDIPKVGEVLYGHPAMANIFINALVNRIALVKVKSAVFNNAYAELKKGYLEFGETVEEVFVGIAKARAFSAEKAASREFKRSLPDVRAAFHCINWRAQYPITIQNEDLRMAFTSFNGVEDLIAKIVDSVYTAAEYDEFLLFKYLMIKAISHGKMFPVAFDSSNAKNAAKKFRGLSNKLTFMSNQYNASGVQTTTPKADQYIFMDSEYNATYDVDVLAGAFNMDKAEFIGKLKLIDDWGSFDNARFDEIRAESDGIEEVTAEELALCSKVKAVLIDEEWFQVYDNLTNMTEKYVAGGMYWNYFYNTWKIISSSPFSNAIVFVDDESETTMPDTITCKVEDKSTSKTATVLSVIPQFSEALKSSNYNFVQNEAAVRAGIGVQKYGAILIPKNASAVKLQFVCGNRVYISNNTVADTAAVGDSITFTATDFISDRLSALTIGAITLTPTFNGNTFTYTGSTTTASNKLTATPVSENATVVCKLGDTVVTNGENISLSAGENVVTVAVTGFVDSAASTKTYTVTITKS